MPSTAHTSTDPAAAARVTAELHNLPTGRLTGHNGVAHIVTDDAHDLWSWLKARGGYTTRERAGLGVTLWTLRTTTEPRADGSTTPIHVHAIALPGESVHPDITESLA